MARSLSALVHIDPKRMTLLIVGALLSPGALGAMDIHRKKEATAGSPEAIAALPPSTPSEAAAATPSSDHTGHHAPVPSSAPPSAAPSPAPRAYGLPSWFPGGEALKVPAYYDSFKGIDLESLTPVQRERFLHWVNTEFCTCSQSGCRRDTIANCYTNDPACPWAPVRIREILENVRRGAAVPGTPRPSPAATPSSPTR